MTEGVSLPVLPSVVAEAARRFGDLPAFVDVGRGRLSFTELHRRTDEVAAGMARRGIGEGSIVALTLGSDTSYVIAYLAAAKLGAITAGVNPRLAPVEQQRCLDLVDPELVVADADQLAGLAVTGGAPAALGADIDRPVAIVFTSGTTGMPKGALFTDRQMAAVSRIDTGGLWGDGTPTATFASTQLAHVGYTTKLAWHIRLGMTTHLLSRWRAADVLDLVERERIAAVGAVAPQFALMLRDPAFDRRDLSCVTGLIAGGAASPPALIEEARRRFGAGYSARYSLTESGGVGTGTAFDAPDAEALFTVGRPRGGIEMAIWDEAGRVVEPGEAGEVCLRSDSVMAGYYRAPEATAEVLVDGWLRTGDLGRINEAGCLVLAGRAKDIFIRGGYNVAPLEVEAVLSRHPGVAQVAVVPQADPVMGEIGVAVIVAADPDAPPTLDQLREMARGELASFKLPERLVVVPELPLTSAQKLDRRALTDRVNRPDPVNGLTG